MIDQAARRLTAAQLQDQFDLAEDEAAALQSASGGWVSFARAAVDAVESSGRALSELVSSAALADFVVAHSDEFSLSLSPADQRALGVLSLLDGFDDDMAAVALEVAFEQWPEHLRADVPTVLLRLQISGAVTSGAAGTPWHVPVLVAAWARRALAESTPNGESATAESALAESLTAQVELVGTPDALLLDNALVLARRTRRWRLLDRIFLTCGYPLFYLFPRSGIATFARLPASALRAVPELEEITTVATIVQETLLSFGPGEGSPDSARICVARLTAPGASHTEYAVQPDQGDSEDESQPIEEIGTSMRFHTVMNEMARLGGAGEHRTAAESGASWIAGGVARRSHRVVRLQASIHSVLAEEPGRALALLRSIEDEVKAEAAPGDFLPPAVIAWSALASYLAGDQERADAELAEFALFDDPPFVQEQTFRPAALVVQAYRSLDALNLADVEAVVRRMRDYPDMGELWYHVPIIERKLFQLTATTRSALLRSEESIEVHAHRAAATDRRIESLAASRIGMLISLGQLHRAESLLESITGPYGIGQVLQARGELAAGRNGAAVRIAEAQYYENHICTRDRAELTGIKAAALLRLGDREEALNSFAELLELSVLVGSLLPVVQMPIIERRELLRASADRLVWQKITRIASPVSGGDLSSGGTPESLIARLGELGAAVAGVVDFPTLGHREMVLLESLERGASVADIARDLMLVQGTVKNNLSSLYRKLGVNSRDAAVARARTLGYLDAGGA
ncbi:helix-turn-helix transcriptional regulator [Brevibacterium sp. JSBI002]|uniref:helix-turn-helix transcriptional regulator n=1 Tax=Brevibacterium sp. JSBI002 TaxID=2886045 RepID=UPI00222F9513|nr:LuxR C-terminal-related transcriptional regulator [Brevibacterium sp. JSBI002]UZD62005.1 LuxR C-terminal-related transcriptional regulator [Brevibacterium sp. JSBI002]